MTKKIIKLCKKTKIKKIIYISGLGVTSKSTSAYFISKYKAEQEIIKSGLDYTILRASYIIGKNDSLTKKPNAFALGFTYSKNLFLISFRKIFHFFFYHFIKLINLW